MERTHNSTHNTYLPECKKIFLKKNCDIRSASEDVEDYDSHSLLMEIQHGMSILEIMYLLYGPAILFLGIYPGEIKTCSHRDCI